MYGCECEWRYSISHATLKKTTSPGRRVRRILVVRAHCSVLAHAGTDDVALCVRLKTKPRGHSVQRRDRLEFQVDLHPLRRAVYGYRSRTNFESLLRTDVVVVVVVALCASAAA